MVLSFHELAEKELNDAAQFYDQEQVGLGAAFIADVRCCTEAILRGPRSRPAVAVLEQAKDALIARAHQ